MAKITVKSVIGPITKTKKDGTGTFDKYTVEDTTGAKYDTFDPNILTARPGSVLDVEIKAKGKFMDLEKWAMVTPGPAEAAVPSVSPASPAARSNGCRSAEDRASIEAQCAYKIISSLWVAGRLPDDHPLCIRLTGWLDKKTAGTGFADVQWEGLKRPEETSLVPGSDAWIISKVKELRINEAGLLSYMNKDLHIPVEATLGGTVKNLTDKQRQEVARAISAKEKTAAQ